MDPQFALSRSGGVARSDALQRLGVSKYRLAQEVRSGSLMRPRRGWIALPDADPELISAAQHGVVLSCVTQARRLGLWVLQEDRTHVAAPTPSSHVEAPRCSIHWGTPLVPRAPGLLTDPLDNVLAYVAACQPWESALAIWESALNKGTTTLQHLRSLPFTGTAKKLLAASTPFSDSGLESIFLTRLDWLKLRIVPQAWVHGHRVDFLIGERLVIQIDGATHAGKQRDSDNRHDAVLDGLGYHVIRVGYWQVVDDWPAVQQLIMTALAQGRHLAK